VGSSSYVSEVSGFWDDARTVYQRARKLKPLQILGRQVGVDPNAQRLTLTPDTRSPQPEKSRTMLYLGGGLVLLLLLMRARKGT
jgi:hypothetical protein